MNLVMGRLGLSLSVTENWKNITSTRQFILLMYMKSRDRLFRVGLEIHEVARDQAPSSSVFLLSLIYGPPPLGLCLLIESQPSQLHSRQQDK